MSDSSLEAIACMHALTWILIVEDALKEITPKIKIRTGPSQKTEKQRKTDRKKEKENST